MLAGKIYHTCQRIHTLQTGRISALPIVILMPHSACNCRCAMCDIWKGNRNLKQLTEADVSHLLFALKKLGTRQVLMSGGEALMNANFFKLCALLKSQNISITLLSTGLTIKRHAAQLLELVDSLIVSLDGDEYIHDRIRNIPNAFARLREGVIHIKSLNPHYRITSRTVIHRMNFYSWLRIIGVAREMGIDQVSFLPADVSSHAFNRQQAWNEPRQHEILPGEDELPHLFEVVETIIEHYPELFKKHFIAERPEKLRDIYRYYAAFYQLNAFPFSKCNAPWVSTVIEADGNVRPCFFFDTIGNIHTHTLDEILNSEAAVSFRKRLDTANNETCVKCVCRLNLSPFTNVG